MRGTMGITEQQFAAIARALSDPRRYSILGEIARAEKALPCCGLEQARNVSAATISHHIKELEAAGLIEVVRDGKFAKLTFRRETYDAYVETLSRI